jgi:hypothetical protein
MKTQPSNSLNMRTLRKLVLIPLALLSANFAQATLWTGGGGTDQTWSQGLNWSTSQPPTPTDPLYFEDYFSTGYTNVAGVINNIVDANTSALEAHYTALVPASKAGITNSHFYTTLIPAGVTLTLGNAGYAHTVLSAGDVPDFNTYDGAGSKNYSTITGNGGLVISEPTGNIYVGFNNNQTFPGLATLDMSGLRPHGNGGRLPGRGHDRGASRLGAGRCIHFSPDERHHRPRRGRPWHPDWHIPCAPDQSK